MKKNFMYAVIALALASAVVCSCSKKDSEPEPEPTPKPESMVEPQLAIIKLSQEMQNHVFATPVVDSAIVDSKTNLTTLFYGDGLVLTNPNEKNTALAKFAQSELKIVGTKPYLLLSGGYAIIDWKWWQFHPLSGEFRAPRFYNSHLRMAYSTNSGLNNGAIANEEYYLLNSDWKNVSDLTATWKFTEGEHLNIPEIRYIDCAKLEEYGKYTHSVKEILRKYNLEDLHGLYVLFSGDAEKGKACVAECNAMQSAYVETLKEMIDNNDLDKWTRLRD